MSVSGDINIMATRWKSKWIRRPFTKFHPFQKREEFLENTYFLTNKKKWNILL